MKKNILITGAAGNLGRAAVEKFLSAGHRVISISSPGKSLELSASGDLVPLESDLAQEKSVADVIGQIVSRFGSIDVALLLVGGYAPGNIETTDGDGLRRMYSLNFETAYFTARPVFLQMMKQARGGRILFVGARPALEPKAGKSSLAYALSKSLILKLADFLNAEGATKNVRSTVIVPSTIDTPANRKSMPEADFTSWVTPDAIAEIMAWVTSDGATPLRDTVLKVYGNA